MPKNSFKNPFLNMKSTTFEWTMKKLLCPFWQNVHPPPSFTCQVSGVRCHMSGVRCQMSCVRCYMKFFDFFLYILFLDKVVKLVGGGPTTPSFYKQHKLFHQFYIGKFFFSLHRLKVQTLSNGIPSVGKIHPLKKKTLNWRIFWTNDAILMIFEIWNLLKNSIT